jgi:hypothetical protein
MTADATGLGRARLGQSSGVESRGQEKDSRLPLRGPVRWISRCT